MRKITLIEGQELVNRTKESLGPVWSMNSSNSGFEKKQGPFLFTGQESKISSYIAEIVESSQERLLLSTQNLTDATVIDAITNAVINQGVNVYLLVDTQGFESMLSYNLCKQLLGEVLLRERKNRGLDVVLSDWHLPSKKGLLLSNPLDGTLESVDNNWVMELSKSQIDEFSKHIQHEFWSETEGREVLAPEEARNPRPIAEAPFTLRSLQNEDYILRSYLSTDGDNSKSEQAIKSEKNWDWFSTRSSIKSSVILNGEAIEVGNGAKNILYSSPKNVEPSDGKFANSGISLHLAVGNETYLAGWDRAATGDWHSILRLTTEQAKAANSLLKKYSESPEWFGHSSIKLGDAGNQIIRNGLEIEISDKQTENLGIVHLEKMPDSAEALKTHQPPMNPPESSLARQCTFEWVSAPPVTPSSASEDDLHAEWEGIRSELQKRLNALDELNQPSKIPGFGRKAKELQKSIDTVLETSTTVSDPKSLSTLIDTVEALTGSVGGNLADIKAAEDETARAALEMEQRESHKVAVADAKKAIKDITGRLDKSKGELKKLETDGKKAEGVEKKRIDSDISQLRPKIKQMESDLKQAKEVSTSKFKFKAPASLGTSKKGESKAHKFLGDTSQSKLNIKIPSEALPAAGTVYVDGENRYLAISNWEDVAQGRKDAKRLKATLCATREVLG